MIDEEALTADFVFDRDYQLELDGAGQRWVVADAARPLRREWTISHAACRLVRISDAYGLARGPDPLRFDRRSAGVIRTLESLGLAILLTLEMVKAQAAMPGVEAAAGP